jgi:hypothetical protein
VLVSVTINAPATQVVPTSAIPQDQLDLEMEKLRVLVPSPLVASAAAPKPPTRLVSNRKGSHPKPPGRPEKPATPPPSIHFRKATSEPALLNPNGAGEDVARKIRLLKAEKTKVALKENVEEQDVVVAKRNNFLMDVFKREKQIQYSEDARDPLEADCSPLSAVVDTDVAANSTLLEGVAVVHNNLVQNSPPAQFATVEDEERFLRLLGWVPDEEDHVPELEEDEIAEVRLKINSQHQVLCK